MFSFQVPPGHSCLLLQVLELKGNKLACSLSQKVVFFCPRKGPFKGLFQLCSGSYCAKEQTRLFFRTLVKKNQDFFFSLKHTTFLQLGGICRGFICWDLYSWCHKIWISVVELSCSTWLSRYRSPSLLPVPNHTEPFAWKTSCHLPCNCYKIKPLSLSLCGSVLSFLYRWRNKVGLL